MLTSTKAVPLLPARWAHLTQQRGGGVEGGAEEPPEAEVGAEEGVEEEAVREEVRQRAVTGRYWQRSTAWWRKLMESVM